jgi:predicted PolB exonuclease-like 3'-5' exonuclease
MKYLVVDVATAPVTNVTDYVSRDQFDAPSNYVDPVKIERAINDAYAKGIEMAGVDVDLAQISGIGFQWSDEYHSAPMVLTARPVDGAETPEMRETWMIAALADAMRRLPDYFLCTFNGLAFDLPLLERRALYLGVPFPRLNLDRYRTPHKDMLEELTYRGRLKSRSLAWYAKRHGWTDIAKPLTGEQESKVFETGQWDELVQSITHDVTATLRLAKWWGIGVSR